jgi:hypothetical protein
MTRWLAACVLLLGGCSWIYDSPYDQAIYTGGPVEPPPGSNGVEDLQAELPYERSPWFDEDRLRLPEDSPIEPYMLPEDRRILERLEQEGAVPEAAGDGG